VTKRPDVGGRNRPCCSLLVRGGVAATAAAAVVAGATAGADADADSGET
jgi:hypothetical protein